MHLGAIYVPTRSTLGKKSIRLYKRGPSFRQSLCAADLA